MSAPSSPSAPVLTRDGKDGFPPEDVFEEQVNEYLSALNPRKRDKALMTDRMYSAILSVLRDPRNTSLETAQFRFWTKKMFRLVTTPDAYIVTHENRPVAVKSQIYDVLVQCHSQASHGGRDKTSAQVRRYYSWIPKELIARFVKICPLCNARRGGNRAYFIPAEGEEPIYTNTSAVAHALISVASSPPKRKMQELIVAPPVFEAEEDSGAMSSLPQYQHYIAGSPFMYGLPSVMEGQQMIEASLDGYSRPITAQSVEPNSLVDSPSESPREGFTADMQHFFIGNSKATEQHYFAPSTVNLNGNSNDTPTVTISGAEDSFTWPQINDPNFNDIDADDSIDSERMLSDADAAALYEGFKQTQKHKPSPLNLSAANHPYPSSLEPHSPFPQMPLSAPALLDPHASDMLRHGHFYPDFCLPLGSPLSSAPMSSTDSSDSYRQQEWYPGSTPLPSANLDQFQSISNETNYLEHPIDLQQASQRLELFNAVETMERLEAMKVAQLEYNQLERDCVRLDE